MFTYQHIREELKKFFNDEPMSCMLPCTIDWITREIKKLPEKSIVVEFGTCVGGTSVLLSKANPDVEIHTIDLNNFEDWLDDEPMIESFRTFYNIPELKKTDLLELQKIQTEDYNNIFLYTGDSISLDINNISMALIDASHFEEDVIVELEYLWPRMIDGAYIFGDDAHVPGVANAFLKFAKSKDIEVTFYSKCARIQKQEPISIKGRNNCFEDTLLFSEEKY